MKRWIYFGMEGGNPVPIPLLPRGKERAGAFTDILLSPLWTDMEFLDFPKAGRDELEQMIRFRLESCYPASPEDTGFSFFPFSSPEGVRAAVSLMHRQSLELIRTAADGGRLHCHLPNADAAGESSGVFSVFPDCLQLFLSRNGLPVFREVLPRKEGEASFLLAFSRWGENLSGLDRLQMTAAEEELTRVKSLLEQSGGSFTSGSGPEVQYIPLETLLREGDRQLPQAFQADKRRGIPRKVRLAVLFCGILLCTVLLAFRQIAAEQEQLSALKKEYRLLQQQARAVTELQLQRDQLINRLEVLEHRTPPDAYRFLTLLTDTLGSGVQVRNLSLRDRTFELESTASSPFSLMKRFESRSRDFSDIRIFRVTPLQNGKGEEFSLMGSYHGR